MSLLLSVISMREKMADVYISSRAYYKIILHAAKYPHCAINGVLLAKKNKGDGKSADLQVVDAIPLFHICLHVSPMAEIALTMVDQYASNKGLVIAGYYLANENLDDVSTDKPAHRIADKIAENYNGALLVVVNNRDLTLETKYSPLIISQHTDGKWRPKQEASINIENDTQYSAVLQILIKLEEYKKLVDFDNHLDNISLDWQNKELNEVIDLLE